jgi:hypothetical protein
MSRARENSEIVESLRELTGRLNDAAEQSWLWHLGGTLKRWTRSSYCYRWLTKEPDPDVIVIDLRETYTVGPILAAMDQAGEFVAGTRAGQTGADWLQSAASAIEQRPIRLFSIVALVALVTNTVVTLALGGLGPTGLGIRLLVLGGLLLGTRSSATAADLADSWLWKLLEPPELEEDAAGRADGGAKRDSKQETDSEPADAADDAAADTADER